MKAKIKTVNGSSILKLELDLNQLLDDNFGEICNAIALKGQVLNELHALLEKDPEAMDSLYQIVQSSCGEDEAISNLQERLSISKNTAQYLLDMSLEQLSVINAAYVKKSISDYKGQIADICKICNG